MGSTTGTGRARWATTTTALATLLIIAGCSPGDDGDATSDAIADDGGVEIAATGLEAPADVADEEEAAEVVMEDADATRSAPGAGSAGGAGSAPSSPLGLDELGRAVAVEAGVTLGTSDVRATLDRTLEIIRTTNGVVDAADVRIGTEYEDGSVDGGGRITAKVPPADLERLIAALDGDAGALLGRTQVSADVTDQLIDLGSRIAVERTTIEQFEQLLAQATEFGDIVEIRAAIGEHATTLERLLASQRALEDRVELSTLTIDVEFVAPSQSELPTAQPAEDDGIGDRFRAGWEAFAGALFAIALVLAVSAPFVVAALCVAAIVWLIVRFTRPRADRPHAGGRTHPGPVGGPSEDAEQDDQEQLAGATPRE